MQVQHRIHRSGWLRATVLGANDGIVSTASLIIGVAAASSEQHTVVMAGTAGLVAGAMSMAAGEYVSVSSQADLERADIRLEKDHQTADPDFEHQELASIYRKRGLSHQLADQVATELMNHDALGAHVRDELGIDQRLRAKPFLAALSSACAFTAGGLLPLIVAILMPLTQLTSVVALVCILCLMLLGAVAAYAGGASTLRGATRIALWGAGAMLATALVGQLFEISV